METLIKYIGLLDHDNVAHGVRLKEGLNIITGRSSTGKSALIEIFDYCMGAMSSTIPKGVITDNAELFFLVVKIGLSQWVIGHSAQSKGAFYIQLDNERNYEEGINLEYFNAGNQLNEKTFKRKLGYLFGLTIPNTQEEDDLQYTNKIKGRPSVRNMMSYILQHQNLVASKLALFYRFDEKEKKDDVIEQFKIFAGYVDAEYYDMSSRIGKMKSDLRTLSYAAENEQKRKELLKKEIDRVLVEYKEITDNSLFDIQSSEWVMRHAVLVKEKVEKATLQDILVTQKEENAEHVKTYNSLLKRENEINAEIRSIQMRIQDYEDSISYTETYKKELAKASFIEEAPVDYSVCPFCKQHTPIIENEVKDLQDSIRRLNKNIKELPLLNDELYSKRTEALDELTLKYKELEEVENQKRKLHNIIVELRKNRSLAEQGFKKMLELESYADFILELDKENAQSKYLEMKSKLEQLQADFKSRYNIEKKMENAQAQIEKYMSEYRQTLSFEKSLSNSILKFDLDTFELAFVHGSEKTRLRSIGSGKNWLNAHLCLFMALARFFYETKDSKLPSLLFIDQPSQVYFPTIDHDSQFSADEMVAKEKGAIKENADEKVKEDRKRLVDQDMEEVTTIFNMLYKFTKDLNFGVQVIVTEHADKLNMGDEVKFDDLVRARWRKDNEGLIMDRTSIEEPEGQEIENK